MNDARNIFARALGLDHADHLQTGKQHVVGATLFPCALMRILRISGPFRDREVLAARWPHTTLVRELLRVRLPARVAQLLIDETARRGLVELDRVAGRRRASHRGLDFSDGLRLRGELDRRELG